MSSLYSCKSQIDGSGNLTYRITKFDDDMNVESSYTCTETECECPAGVRPSCRHRDMLPKFIARNAVNSMWLYHFDRGGWISSDVHLEGALAREEPELYGIGPVMHDLPALRKENEKRQQELAEVEARSALCTSQSTPLLRRF